MGAIELTEVRPSLADVTKPAVIVAPEEPLQTPEARELLTKTAKDTWECIAKMSETELGVVDDKIWPDSENMLGGKTSPAYIGLATLSAIAAYDLGIIPNEEKDSYIGTSLAALQGFDRHTSGLYFNWYDTDYGNIYTTNNGQTIYPFVPTVDNAILATCLMAIQNTDNPSNKNYAEDILSEMDFPFLYDRDENLFRGGYEYCNQKLTDYHLDMLTSDTRFATYVGIERFGIPEINYHRLGRSAPAPKKEGRNVVYKPNGRWHTWRATMFEIAFPATIIPETQWNPNVFGTQHRVYIENVLKTAGWVDPSDDHNGSFVERGSRSREVGHMGYGTDGAQTPAAIFSGLMILPEEAIRAIAQAQEIPNLYHEGYGFRDSFKPNETEFDIAPTCLSFNQTRLMLSCYNILKPNGKDVYTYTAPVFDRIVGPLIANEPPTNIIG